MFVPRHQNLEEKFRDSSATKKVTTLMIRNVPNRYCRSLFMQELDSLGFRGKYNFVYLPMDNATHWNVGYAFVNFEDPADAERCVHIMEGHEFARYKQRRRVAQVSVAHIQGLERNLAHYSASAVSSLPLAGSRPWVRHRRQFADADGDESDQKAHCIPDQGHTMEAFIMRKIMADKASGHEGGSAASSSVGRVADAARSVASDTDIVATDEDLQRWERDMIGSLLDEEEQPSGMQDDAARVL